MTNEIFLIILFISSSCFGYFLGRLQSLSKEFEDLHQKADNLKEQTEQMSEEFNKSLKDIKNV